MDRPEVKVGEGATLVYYSDKKACTVVSVEERFVVVQEDKVHRLDTNGMSDQQTYTYEPNPEGKLHTYQWNPKTERWDQMEHNPKSNRWKKTYYNTRIWMGVRREFYDYSF